MKKLKTTLKISVLVLLPWIVQGQTSITNQSKGYLLWKGCNALLQNESAYKNTNTVKKAKAYSLWVFGEIMDSMAVVKPYNDGVSKFDYINLSIVQAYFNADYYQTYGISNYAQFDYETAYQYTDSTFQRDTISKTYNSAHQLLSRVIYNHTPFSNNYGSIEETYFYDNQGRLDSLNRLTYYTTTTGAESVTIMSFDYDPNGNYINVDKNFMGVFDTVIRHDSITITNNLVSKIFIYEDSVLGYVKHYTYDQNNELTKIEEYDGMGQFISLDEIANRPGSDFPDSFMSKSIFISDTSISKTEYFFNASNSALNKVVTTTNYQNSFDTFVTLVNTDIDGDITDYYQLLNRTDTVFVAHFYYEDSTSNINNHTFGNLDIKAYPVPSSDFLNISSEDKFDAYILFDQNGRVVKKENFGNTKIKIVDLRSIPVGQYFLQVISKDKHKTMTVQRK